MIDGRSAPLLLLLAPLLSSCLSLRAGARYDLAGAAGLHFEGGPFVSFAGLAGSGPVAGGAALEAGYVVQPGPDAGVLEAMILGAADFRAESPARAANVVGLGLGLDFGSASATAFHFTACLRRGSIQAFFGGCARWTPEQWISLDLEAGAGPFIFANFAPPLRIP